MTIAESPAHIRKPWRWVALALGLIGLAGVSTWWWFGVPSPRRWRLSVALNTFGEAGELAFSPDGRTIATPGIRMLPPFARDFPKGLIRNTGPLKASSSSGTPRPGRRSRTWASIPSTARHRSTRSSSRRRDGRGRRQLVRGL